LEYQISKDESVLLHHKQLLDFVATSMV